MRPTRMIDRCPFARGGWGGWGDERMRYVITATHDGDGVKIYHKERRKWTANPEWAYRHATKEGAHRARDDMLIIPGAPNIQVEAI